LNTECDKLSSKNEQKSYVKKELGDGENTQESFETIKISPKKGNTLHEKTDVKVEINPIGPKVENDIGKCSLSKLESISKY